MVVTRLGISNFEVGCYWEGNKLFFRSRSGKERHIANYKPCEYFTLETFHNGSTYYVGRGKSSTLGVEVETYWSRVDGTTFLIQFDPKTGRTMVHPERTKTHYTCTKDEPCIPVEDIGTSLKDSARAVGALLREW